MTLFSLPASPPLLSAWRSLALATAFCDATRGHAFVLPLTPMTMNFTSRWRLFPPGPVAAHGHMNGRSPEGSSPGGGTFETCFLVSLDGDRLVVYAGNPATRLLRKGEAKGRAEGEAKGREEGILATARKMKALGISVAIVSEATGLTKEQIESL